MGSVKLQMRMSDCESRRCEESSIRSSKEYDCPQETAIIPFGRCEVGVERVGCGSGQEMKKTNTKLIFYKPEMIVKSHIPYNWLLMRAYLCEYASNTNIT